MPLCYPASIAFAINLLINNCIENLKKSKNIPLRAAKSIKWFVKCKLNKYEHKLNLYKVDRN